jgi:hypothetical protein
MSLVLNVEILGEFKKLTAATQGANKQLKGMGDRSKKISQGIRRAFATIGVGLSFAAIVKGFKDTTKAAQIDIKGREQLTLAIENNTDASEDQIKGIHEYIAATEIASAISDDELRPAFANLVRATKDVTKSQKLMEVALDVSAGTGKSLEAVTQAMGRALNGSNTALNRLVPSLKNSKNPMEDLAAAFKGANEEASKQKTWERFEIIMGNLQEMIGEVLLPILEDFSDWFTKAYPKVQDFFRNLKNSFNDPEVKESFRRLEKSLGNLTNSIGALFGSTETDEAKGFVNFWKTFNGILEGIFNLAAALVAPLSAMFGNTSAMENWLDYLLDLATGGGVSNLQNPTSIIPPSPTFSKRQMSGSKTYNINIGGSNVSAQEIVNKIAQLERSQGRKYLA